ncbi:MAG: cobalt-zinc-cadmium efflux system outer membrane protein [Methylophagaceae bacterium]|jgi:cobalt-zinc-cadmium efflux system outer membrane protein
MWKLRSFASNKYLLLILLVCSIQLSRADGLEGLNGLNGLNQPMSEYSSTEHSAALTLSAALSRVQLENIGLAEIQARAQAMAAIPSQVGSLPDPMISFNALNLPTDSFNVSQEAMTQMQFSISQQIPYPGKLVLKQSVARRIANVADSTVDEMRLKLNQDVKTIWWQLFLLDRSLDVIEINKTLLRQFIEIAQTKYKVGQGLQQDVLLAQLELSKLIDYTIQLTSSRKQSAAQLNVLLNQPSNQTVRLPALAEIDIVLPQLISAKSIFNIAEQHRPALAQQRLLIDAATDRKKLAERDLLPDFNVGAAYGFRDGNNTNGADRADFLSFKVGINVPIFAQHKQKMAISQRHSEVKQQQFALQDRWLNIQADITSTIAQYEQAKEQVLLFKTGIIPQAHQTVASMLAGYQVNKVDFLNLIRAQITLYNYQTNEWKAISDAKTALAKLVATVGEENIYE